MIAAIQVKDYGIGIKNNTLVRISGDMKHFVAITTPRPKHPVIMGRKTYDSFPEKYRPLPDRTNIVITRNTGLSFPEGVIVVDSLMSAVKAGKKISDDITIIGGGQIYQMAFDLHIVDTLELTIIESNFEADTFFPSEWTTFGKMETKELLHDEKTGLSYTFVTIRKE